jgi:hypothetical protein
MTETYRVGYTLPGYEVAVEYTAWVYTRLDEALAEAEQLTRAGQCSFVRRLSDDAILLPDGSWL